MRNKFINEALFLLFLILSYSSISFFYAHQHLNGHWTALIDQEMVLAYNSLLFNSGIEQEFVDHSGYFTFLTTSLYFKILNYFNIIEVYKFSQIYDYNLVQIFENSIYHLRFFSIYITIIMLVTATYLFDLLFKNKSYSFFLVIILFFLFGNLSLLSSTRTEQFSVLFILLSLIGLFNFFEKNKLIYFIIFLFFIFCSILNKSQVIFQLPLILLYSFYINKKPISFNYEFLERLNANKLLIYVFVFFFIFLTLKSLVFLRDYKSWIFLIAILSFLNFFFLKISNKKKRINNVLILNYSIIVSYFFFNIIIFLHPSASLVSLEKTIFAVIKYTSLYNSDISNVSFFEFLLNLIKILLVNFTYILNKFFFSINSYSIILFGSMIIFFLNLKLYSRSDKKVIVALVFSFFGIFSINLIRGDFPQYYSYIDYVIVMLLGFVLKDLKKKFSICYLTIFIILVFYLNIYKNQINPLKKVYSDQTVSICNDYRINENNFLTTWHKKIPLDKFEGFCFGK